MWASGFGEKIASYYGPSDMKVINLGLEKKFYDRYNPQQLPESLGITAEKIVERVKKFV